jgi:hypothetical protein
MCRWISRCNCLAKSLLAAAMQLVHISSGTHHRSSDLLLFPYLYFHEEASRCLEVACFAYGKKAEVSLDRLWVCWRSAVRDRQNICMHLWEEESCLNLNSEKRTSDVYIKQWICHFGNVVCWCAHDQKSNAPNEIPIFPVPLRHLDVRRSWHQHVPDLVCSVQYTDGSCKSGKCGTIHFSCTMARILLNFFIFSPSYTLHSKIVRQRTSQSARLRSNWCISFKYTYFRNMIWYSDQVDGY